MRTLTICHRSWIMRLYDWAWDVDSEKISMCKLFWGIILFPLGLVLQKVNSASFLRGSAYVYLTGAAVWILITSLFYLLLRDVRVFFEMGPIAVYTALVGLVLLTMDLINKRMEILQQGFLKIETLYWILDRHALAAADLKTSRHIGGFFVLIAEYIRASKQRVCPLVQVV